MSDLYKVLDVARGADPAEIKRAYRKAAKSCHPDLQGGDKGAEQRFKEVNRAYGTLSNPLTRALYDEACAEAQSRARRRFRRVAATMAASFTLTVSTGALAGFWLLVDGRF
jgi:DnaJ-class molecular chaperone